MTLPSGKNYTPSDLMNRYAKENAGVKFYYDHYFRAILEIAGICYCFDCWNIADNGDGTETATMYLYTNARQRTVKVRFENGDEITTKINGAREEVFRYFRPGTLFNLGTLCDNMQRVVSCEIIE